MKNICAMSNFIQVLLTQGYHFDENSFPSISFTEKVRSNKLMIFICWRDNYPQHHVQRVLCLLILSIKSCDLQAGGASVGWALGYMLNVTNEVPAESLRVVTALTPGTWAAILVFFIIFMLFSAAYFILTYRSAQTNRGIV